MQRSFGECRTPEYRAWRAMITRCTRPNASGYRYYGARGICVCSEWTSSYESFLSHIGRRPSPVHSVDRINAWGNYEPGNVRWATRVQQANNRTDNHIVEFRGDKVTLAEANRRAGETVTRDHMATRIARGWSVDRAVSEPAARHGGQRTLTDEQTQQLRDLSKSGGWPQRKLAKRFGLSARSVGRILRHEAYVDVA